ncbi:hypothetical protein BDY19DRAFT_988519 [Irpex rosettiformis]|uniref:Uncharacterized protein n=1 Tax=Irpex rosettiformis TaxID=378272 RepID=A0ACB8UK57_9APHY|nr:hypothetical protein BDY19DRAFT_988519 [Irpex rosettiformis]
MATAQESLDQAQDFIRLLRNENNALRKQIQELEKPTASSAKLPSYEEVSVVETLRKECQDLRTERDALQVEMETRQNAPCTDAKHRYAITRADFLSNQLAETLIQREKQEQSFRARISELEDACHKLEQERARSQQNSRTTAQQPSNTNALALDVSAFIQEINRREASKPRLYKGPFSNVLDFQLPKGAADLMTSSSLRFSHAELIWKSPGADRFLALVPAKLFDPTHNRGQGKWASGVVLQELTGKRNQRRELFFLHDHAWHYYGEYECVGSVPLTAKEVEEIGSAQKVAYAEKRTLLDPERAPPGMTKQIHDMYAEGSLKIQCLGFRRVRYNEPLNKLLEEKGAWTGSRKMRTPKTNSDATSSVKQD